MEQVLFLLVTLAGVTHAFLPAAETKCDATSNTSVLCQVHLGGTVYIQMMNNASRHQLRCKKYLPTGTISVFSLKKEKVTIEEPFRNKTTEFFINNGTLKITNVEKNHSGRYNLEVFDPRGIQVKNIDINLDVQDHFWLIIVCSVGGGLLILALILCCVCCWKARCNKKSDRQTHELH
ncbi:hypothetical protein E3U43_001824 [Larimichthys crocea]|uniref:Uncharacterized protein n=1 Tax=Larimichthys crocea TaxID=215358 RepID=A0ACD3REF2_LARCR|nr:hypothetical protein E3U43_001824 [Larimichthys crocea]